KVFRHDPANPDSLSGVTITALFRDRSGRLWVGTDQFLDRFDPVTESFRHYRIASPGTASPGEVVQQISQDSRGMLWLSTHSGLFRLNPDTDEVRNFRHNADDPDSLSDNDIKTAGEDRQGAFWVGTSKTLDEFDRDTGKVKRHIDIGESGVGVWFHEDRFGVFWVIYHSEGRIATLDRSTGKLIQYGFDWGMRHNRLNQAYAMLEDRDGTMWFGTGAAGLLKFDREHGRFISYRRRPEDADSLADNRVIALYEDREGNIWVGLHQVEPNFFRKEPLPFANLSRLTGIPNSLGPGLVSAVFEDRNQVLWVASDRLLKQLDRRSGQYDTFPAAAGSEVMSIVEDGPDALWIGNAGPGLIRYNWRTGESRGYRHDRSDPTTLCSGVVHRLLVDRRGTLWAATWDGLCHFDSASQRFTTYKPDPKERGLNYYAIVEAPDGHLWLGGNLGLHRFDPQTRQFVLYRHDPNDPASLSSNRVHSVLFDHSGMLWVGTQNGLNRFDSKTGKFAQFGERQGMAGNAVSCILEDRLGRLWLSTNKGVSSFDRRAETFANYTVADGLPGPDMTGSGACFQNQAGEMFFAGFSGATAFFPDRLVDSMYAPPTVLTDFRLFGTSVNPGGSSPLKQAVNHTKAITLTHEQDIFSVEFSALTYFNTATNRYRYMLEPLESSWHQTGADERLATYTTLPAGSYRFRVQAATSRGPWSPEVVLAIEMRPPVWKTTWFRASLLVLGCCLMWVLYRMRLRQVSDQLSLRFEERVAERIRIAQELHDTLLQQFQAAHFFLGAAEQQLPELPQNEQARKTLARSNSLVSRSITEARTAIMRLRPGLSADFALRCQAEGERLTMGTEITFHLEVGGAPQALRPEVTEEALQITREALANAVRHSQPKQLFATIRFTTGELRVCIHDDGVGIDPESGESGRAGQYEIQSLRERAQRIGGRLEVVTSKDAGTGLVLMIPARIAYVQQSFLAAAWPGWLSLTRERKPPTTSS
ncbi:MAG TPA: two-component regulator propeller domain-containing protein, partial [Bryobacteraceae bacterium]|nr:two-component regulator propeller domain-containing protein [Bryobacteraceae bacterium]